MCKISTYKLVYHKERKYNKCYHWVVGLWMTSISSSILSTDPAFTHGAGITFIIQTVRTVEVQR